MAERIVYTLGLIFLSLTAALAVCVIFGEPTAWLCGLWFLSFVLVMSAMAVTMP